MRVKKRDGRLESVDVMKIVRAVERSCDGLDRVDGRQGRGARERDAAALGGVVQDCDAARCLR